MSQKFHQRKLLEEMSHQSRRVKKKEEDVADERGRGLQGDQQGRSQDVQEVWRAISLE